MQLVNEKKFAKRLRTDKRVRSNSCAQLVVDTAVYVYVDDRCVCGVACRRVVPLTPGRQSSGEVVVVCRLTEFSALNWRTAIMRPPTADGRRATTILMIRRSFKNTYIVVLLLF